MIDAAPERASLWSGRGGGVSPCRGRLGGLKNHLNQLIVSTSAAVDRNQEDSDIVEVAEVVLRECDETGEPAPRGTGSNSLYVIRRRSFS